MPEGTRRGRMIVIEGADGAGKSTQAHVLVQRLTAAGYDVEFIKFPQYDNPSSHFIRSYLNGDYGPARDIGPYTAALFYALDRYEAVPRIQRALNEGKIIVADRYVASNMAHQGSKIIDSIEQRSFFIWEDSLEFQLLGVPRPDLNIFLRLPPETSYSQSGKGRQRSYTSRRRDEHEKDLEHLRATAQAYDTLCELFPRDFKAVDASEKDQLLSIAELSNRIWMVVKPLLPAPTHKGRALVLNLKSPEPLTPSPKDVNSEPAPKAASETRNKSISLLALNQLMSMAPEKLPFRSSWLDASAKKGQLKWVTPPRLPADIAKKFDAAMGIIINNRDALIENVGAEAAQLLTPLAAKFNIELPVATMQLEMRLSELAEIRRLAPVKNNDHIDAEAEVSKIRQFITDKLTKPAAADGESMSLIEINPRNEMDLLAPAIYAQSQLSQRFLADEIDSWPYEQKAEALNLALDQYGSSAPRRAKYSFDALDDRLIMMELYKSGAVKSIRLQDASIQFGIEVPPAVEAAGLEAVFQEAVSASEDLFQMLTNSGWKNLAGYACLAGHKVRFQFATNAFSLRKAIQESRRGSAAHPLLKLVAEKISEAQPIIGRWLLEGNAPVGRPKIAKSGKMKSAQRKQRR